MQVKKFEARTMKEALEMVKTQLGPDAIILSARDNNRSFGLVGEGSVEITAAVSEETLQKKKFAESRLRDEDRERLIRSPARVQKQVINQMVTKYVAEKEANAPKAITRTRYIDIDDEQEAAAHAAATASQIAAERIKNAAKSAWLQTQGTWEELQKPSPPPKPKPLSRVAQAVGFGSASQQTAAAPNYSQAQVQHQHQQRAPTPKAPAMDPTEIQALKGEIANLKQVIANFQHVPQTFAAQHPGAIYGLSYDTSAVFEKLVTAGVSEEIAAEILTQAEEQMTPLKLKNKALIEAFAAKFILNSTNVVSDRQNNKVHVFVGPAASGKTSTLIKLGSHLVVREGKKVALVTTDTLKVGAADQMRIYAQILNVPFAVIRQKTDWEKIMAQLTGYDHVLVDCAGVGLKTMEEISFVRNILPPDQLNPQTHLVLSCLAKDSDLTEIGKRYKVTGFHDVVFTGLDESIQHGSIYNFMRRFQVPLHSFGIGTRVPEDFEMATKERVLDLIFKITKMSRTEQQGSMP